MPNHYLLESGAPDGYLNESGVGELLLEGDLNEAASNGGTLLAMPSLVVAATLLAAQMVMADPGMELPTTAPTVAGDEGAWIIPTAPVPDPVIQLFWDDSQRPTPAAVVTLEESEWPLPRPWGQGYQLVPLPGRGGRVDQVASQVVEDQYQPPAPWIVPPQPILLWVSEERPTPPVPFSDNDAGYQPPQPWTVLPQPLLWWADDIEPPQFIVPVRITEDHYFPPQPWGPGYVLRPISGSGSRIDQFQVGQITVAEDEYQPPKPWPVPVQPLLWWPQDEWPTPPAPIITDDTGPEFTIWQREPTVTLWLVDDAPPWNYEDEGWQPPLPWPAQFKSLGPWWPDEQRPTPAAALQVDVDPWPLPRPWLATAYQAILGHPDEQPTPPPRTAAETDPWPLPLPWPVPVNAPLLGWQDELASITALGGAESEVQPVLCVWPVVQPDQPPRGEDEKIIVVPIAHETDELFPKVTPERIWVVPQQWEFEQNAIAFLSPHTPVEIRDRSGPRYIVDDSTGTRYLLDDDSQTRYEVEP